MGNKPAAAASAPQIANRVELISDPSKKGTIIPQPQNQGGASNNGNTIRVRWDSGEIESIGENLIQPVASAEPLSPEVRHRTSASASFLTSPGGSYTTCVGLINDGHIRTADDLAKMESITDCMNHDLRGRAGGPLHGIRVPIGDTAKFKLGGGMLSGVAGGAEHSDMPIVQSLHSRGIHLCHWSGFDQPAETAASFEAGGMYTGSDVGPNLDRYLADAVSEGPVSCLYDTCNMHAVRDAIGRNSVLAPRLVQVTGDASTAGADRGGSRRGTGTGPQKPYVFPIDGLHQGGNGFVEGIDYTLTAEGRIRLSIRLHLYPEPFVHEFGRTALDHIPGIGDITQILSHLDGAAPPPLDQASRDLLTAIDTFAGRVGVPATKLTEVKKIIIACLKPQADESRTMTAKDLIEKGNRPVVFTGDLRAFYSCAKKNITAIFVSSTKCLYYKRKEGGVAMQIPPHNFGRQGRVLFSRTAVDSMSKKEYLEKRSQAAELNNEIKKARRIIDQRERDIDEWESELAKDKTARIDSYKRLDPETRRKLQAYIDSANEVIRKKEDEIEEKEAQIFSLIGKKFMGGGDEELHPVQRHVQIVRVMSAYLLNNLTKLLSENIDETMPDVFIYIVPLFTIVPDGQTITDYVNPGILDRSGSGYINNFELRMPILELFDELIDPCAEGGDVNECVDTFMNYAGYFPDEPVVGVLKRVMQGEVVSDAEIDDPAFNGIDVISRHETLFNFMRPPLIESSSADSIEALAGKKGASMLTPPPSNEIKDLRRRRLTRQRNITGGGSSSTATRRRQRQRQRQQKAERLGGLQATFEIVPHQS